MQRLLSITWIALIPFLLASGCSNAPEKADRSQVEIIKVLPHLLDLEGQHTPSPSLYERDAYQGFLREQPEKQSGLRFDVLWKAPLSAGLVLKVEMRGIQNKKTTMTMLESEPMAHEGGREWSALELTGEPFQAFGKLQAWRVSLWSGDLLTAEQHSYLW